MKKNVNTDMQKLNAMSDRKTGADFQVDVVVVGNAASCGLAWLKEQEMQTVKDISRSIQALSLWNEPASILIEKLISMKKDGYWETETPINDTARADIALSGCRNIQPEIIHWIQKKQKNDNWNNNEIDTSYALISLADRGIKNENGCQWLISNYGKKWEHPGTTSLIITALAKQDKTGYEDFINDRAGWLLSKREDRGWKYIATSNLVIQALILSGVKEQEITPSIAWLLGKQEDNGSWKDTISTSLTLISLKMYLDKFNGGSDTCSDHE
jgi:squalene cyclase